MTVPVPFTFSDMARSVVVFYTDLILTFPGRDMRRTPIALIIDSVAVITAKPVFFPVLSSGFGQVFISKLFYLRAT